MEESVSAEGCAPAGRTLRACFCHLEPIFTSAQGEAEVSAENIGYRLLSQGYLDELKHIRIQSDYFISTQVPILPEKRLCFSSEDEAQRETQLPRGHRGWL